jgi:hypothetical protein
MFGGYVKGQSFVAWFARRIKRSVELIYMWCRPHTDFTDTGAQSDLDRLTDTIDLSLSQPAISREDSIAPIIYLEEHVGRIGVDLEELEDCDPADLLKHLSKTMKEFSDLTLAVSKDLVDNNKIDKIEVIHAEGWEAIRAIYTLMKKAEHSAK